MIIAVDFDGTLCENRWPDIGAPNTKLIKKLIKMRSEGHKVILWTMRTHCPYFGSEPGSRDLLREAVAFCEAQGLSFDGINEPDADNAKQYGDDSRKIYADIYIDDHNAPHSFFKKYMIPFTRFGQMVNILTR